MILHGICTIVVALASLASGPVVNAQGQIDAQGNPPQTKVDVTPATAVSLVGKWTVTVIAPVGSRPLWLDLMIDPKDPRKLTGTIGTRVTKDVVQGEVVDSEVTFWFNSVGPGGSAVRVTFVGTAQKDGSLAGTLNSGQGPALQWKAVRDKTKGETT